MEEHSSSSPLSGDPAPGGLMVYQMVGSASEAIDLETSRGFLPVRPHLRSLGGIYASAIGVFLQDMAGVNVSHLAPRVVPTHINVRVRERADDVEGFEGRSRVVHRGRSTIVTDARVSAAEDPTRVVAFGTIGWATMGSTREPPPGPLLSTSATEPVHPRAPLMDWLGATPRGDGTGLELCELRPDIREPTGHASLGASVLHAGPMQILIEGAAYTALAARQPGRRAIRTEELATSLLAPARALPIVALAEIISATDERVDLRVDVREGDRDGRCVALGYCRVITEDRGFSPPRAFP